MKFVVVSVVSSMMLLGSMAHADEAIFAGAGEPGVEVASNDAIDAQETVTPVFVDPSIARKISKQPGAQIRTVSEEEAVSAAAARGVTIRPWGHPWVIIKAGLGMPGNIQADIEVYVHQNWAVEVGAGTGLLGGWYTGAVRWHPDATTWNWFKIDHQTGEVVHENSLQLSWGAEVGFTPQSIGWGNQHAAVYVTPQIEAAYIHRFAERFGWTIGTRIGIGPAFNFPPTGQNSQPGPGPSPEPAPTPPQGTPVPSGSGGSSPVSTDLTITFLLYTGFTF